MEVGLYKILTEVGLYKILTEVGLYKILTVVGFYKILTEVGHCVARVLSEDVISTGQLINHCSQIPSFKKIFEEKCTL